jgi:uncharacterized protein YbjT (DUF2867 family)
MPFLVTSAQRPLPRRIVRRLLDEGGEVRAYAHGDATSLRAAGAMVATGEVDDEGRLEAAMEQVHTVIHVGGGLLTTNLDDLERDADVVATAATNAGVRRVILLSLPGADAHAEEPLRRAKGRVEQRFAQAEPPSVVLRVSWLDTQAVTDALLASGLAGELGPVEIAPVRVDDLVELVAAFDRARSSATEGHLVVAADGPERRSLADHLRRREGERASLVGRRLPDRGVVDRLRGAVADGPWWTVDPAVVDGWAFADIVPRACEVDQQAGLPGPSTPRG